MNTSNPDILFTISQSIHSSAFDQLVYVFMRNSAMSPARAKRQCTCDMWMCTAIKSIMSYLHATTTR